MSEVESNLEIDDRLTDHTEAKVARLNNAGMHWADGNFINALATDWRERERRTIVLQVIRRHGILAKREVVLRPERVPHQRPWIRMSNRFDAEQAFNLPPEAGRRKKESGH